MKKLALASLWLALSLSRSAYADFYDGVRGPSKAQVHYTADFHQSESDHTLAIKYFGKDIFAVGAITNTPAARNEFGGLGLILESFDRVKTLPVVGYAVADDGKQGTAQGIIQSTINVDEQGKTLVDTRYILSVPTHGQQDHTPNHTFGMTPSIGNEKFRLGVDLDYTLHQHINKRLLVRYDFDSKDHSSWIEVGLGRDGSTQLQLRGNF